jgi:hypothetical protein
MLNSAMADIKLQLLLRPECRTSSGVATGKTLAQKLGIQITASGAASLSARVSRDVFLRLFQTVPEAAPNDLPVPADLQEVVQSITVAPDHLYLME